MRALKTGLLVGIFGHSPPPQICNEFVWPAHDALICGPGAHLFSCEHDAAPTNRPASVTGIAIDAMPARLTLPCVTELPPIAIVGLPQPVQLRAAHAYVLLIYCARSDCTRQPSPPNRADS